MYDLVRKNKNWKIVKYMFYSEDSLQLDEAYSQARVSAKKLTTVIKIK